MKNLIIGLVLGIIVMLSVKTVLAEDSRFKSLYNWQRGSGVQDIEVVEDTRYKVICYVSSGSYRGGISCIPKKDLGLK